MPIPIIETCRKRKRRPKLFGLHSFPQSTCSINPIAPFRDNIRIFTQNCAEPEDYCVNGMPLWCTLLVHENKNFVVPLYTIQEDVLQSSNPFCDHCRCTGWGNHFVSKRKYHIIIPIDQNWNKPLEDDVLSFPSHLLHGLVHCNGYGHLLSINGIEGGSRYMCGREIMDLWDRICENLGARQISVEDVAKKHGMDLRLLNGVAYGHTWFGRWGYKFYRGSYGVSEKNYDRAIAILSSLELDRIIQDFSMREEQYKQIKSMIKYYRDLSESQLITIRDLFRYLLTVKSTCTVQKKLVAPMNCSAFIPKKSVRISFHRKAMPKEKSTRCKKFTSLLANMDSRWPAKRLEYAAEVIVEALKEHKSQYCHGGGRMTRQDLRDAARLHIGDTGLLDYVLKSMNNVIVGSHVVRRSTNTSRILEYTLVDLNKEGKVTTEDEEEEEEQETKIQQYTLPDALVPGTDAYNDVVYMYNNVLLEYPQSELVELATMAILDSKHFVKHLPFKDAEDQILRFFCKVSPSLLDKEDMFSRPSSPSELVMVPLHATVIELKKAIEAALRDTYCIMDKLVVTDIERLEGLEDEDVVFGGVESGAEMVVRGRGIDWDSGVRHEGGSENWVVRCECGAQDDDGERMVACDICEVWQHTRCCGIADSEAVPPLFVCPGCCTSVRHPNMMKKSPLALQIHNTMEESPLTLQTHDTMEESPLALQIHDTMEESPLVLQIHDTMEESPLALQIHYSDDLLLESPDEYDSMDFGCGNYSEILA